MKKEELLSIGLFLLTPLREGRRQQVKSSLRACVFLLTPLREGRPEAPLNAVPEWAFLLTPLREGRQLFSISNSHRTKFLLTPLREGRPDMQSAAPGRWSISTHAPAGGATKPEDATSSPATNFYSRPCGRGDASNRYLAAIIFNFYSRPCGRGDLSTSSSRCTAPHFYSRPCGRGDSTTVIFLPVAAVFLLTPLREGRRRSSGFRTSRRRTFLLTPLREGRRVYPAEKYKYRTISTHAPAGGATLPSLLGR